MSKYFKKGFTIIELLVVIAIMATLAAGILYSTDNARDKGKDAKRKQDLSAVASALVAYFTDNKIFPPNTSTQRDFASDSTDINGWIPNLNSYIEKLPKDPLQADRGRVAAIQTLSQKIITSADDVQIRHFAPEFSSDDVGIGLGRSDIPDADTAPYPNNDHMKVALRFINLTIPKDATITKATIKFTPRNVTNQEKNLNNAGTSGPNKERVNIFITSDISQASSSRITSAGDFYGRLDTIFALDPNHHSAWRLIPQWNPAPDQTATEVDVTSLVQKNVQISGWSSGNAMNFLMFPEDPPSPYEMTLDSRARFFYSYDANPNLAPELDIEWDDGSGSPPTCNDPLAINFGESLPCTYPPPPADRGSCDNKQHILCARISDDKSAYVLWTQLENTNDPQIFTRPSADCKNTDFTDTSSRYYGLGQPQGGFLNYCVKSPPN